MEARRTRLKWIDSLPGSSAQLEGGANLLKNNNENEQVGVKAIVESRFCREYLPSSEVLIKSLFEIEGELSIGDSGFGGEDEKIGNDNDDGDNNAANHAVLKEVDELFVKEMIATLTPKEISSINP